jgi:hypothetical protein
VRREMIGKARLITSLLLSGGTQRSGEEERLDGGKTSPAPPKTACDRSPG